MATETGKRGNRKKSSSGNPGNNRGNRKGLKISVSVTPVKRKPKKRK